MLHHLGYGNAAKAIEDAIETDLRSGKENAEAFASSRITNPLALARLNAKDPS